MRDVVLREAIIVAVETALLLGLSATMGIPSSDREPVRAESIERGEPDGPAGTAGSIQTAGQPTDRR